MKSVLKLDTDKYLYGGCIPVEYHPERPTDQSFCIVEKCPHCHHDMWVSERKRAMRETMPSFKIYCFICLVIAAKVAGIEPELMDIGQIQ